MYLCIFLHTIFNKLNMKKLFTFTVITLLSVASAAAQEEFKFEVTTTAANQSFAIPLSGGNGGKTYYWNISWGDGNKSLNVTGTGSITSAGIAHTYTGAGTYQITITPAGSNDRWLAAFGFYNNSSGANVQTNKNLVTKVISPITPLMTRTQAEINAGTAPDDEWVATFCLCTNLSMGPAFAFSPAWNSITRVGNNFASYMFYYCSGAAFTMNTIFNLPQNITTVGDGFAYNMFSYCKGAAFTMNTIFNLPQNITTVGNYFAQNMFSDCSGSAFSMNTVFNLPQNGTTVGDDFARSMFYDCYGDAFNMNTVFNLPQNLTTVENNFAYNMFLTCYGDAFNMNTVFNLPQNGTTVGNSFAFSMFAGCSGAAFTMNTVFNLPQNGTTVGTYFASNMFSNCSGDAFNMNTVFNLPQNLTTVGTYFASSMFLYCSGAAFQVNNVFTFPRLAQTEINKDYVFYRTFKNLGTAATQSRTAASIINGNPIPPNQRETFLFSNCFADRAYIPVNWGGDGLSKTFTVTYTYNGATGGNATLSKSVTYNSAYGTLPTPTKDSYTVTYNYNGSTQANSSDAYTPTFGGWYLEATFENEVTNTTIVTTFSHHTIYAKWNNTPLTLPTPAANAGYTFGGWYSEASCVNFVGNAGDSYAPTADTTLYAKWTKNQTGIAETSANNKIAIYPNPTTGHLRVSGDILDGKDREIIIYDVVGQVVFTSQLSKLSPETTIDISHLANGLYFLKVGGKMFKIMKE